MVNCCFGLVVSIFGSPLWKCIHSLKLTAKAPRKTNSFPFGAFGPIFKGYVSFREGIYIFFLGGARVLGWIGLVGLVWVWGWLGLMFFGFGGRWWWLLSKVSGICSQKLGWCFFLFSKIRSGRMGMTKPVAGRYCNRNWSALFGTGII